jgi:hypothetical protein
VSPDYYPLGSLIDRLYKQQFKDETDMSNKVCKWFQSDAIEFYNTTAQFLIAFMSMVL